MIMFLQRSGKEQIKTNLQPFGFSRKTIWNIGMLTGIITLALSLYVIRHDIPGKFFNLLWESYWVWGNPFPEILPFFKLLGDLGSHRMFERILFYLPVLVYFVVIGLLVYRITRKGWENTNLYLLSIASFGICAFGLVVWRAGFDNLLRTLPPFYILFCYLLFLVWKKIFTLFPNDKGKSGVGILVKRTAINVLIVFLPFLFYFEMNFHQGFYAGSIGAMKQEKAFLRLNRLEVYTHPTEAKWLKKLVSRIHLYSREGDPIFVLPLNPVFYFLTDRINPTLHDWILPGMLDKEHQEKVVSQLEAKMPKLIVYADIAIDGKEDRRFSNYAPIIFKFIAENYRLIESFGFFNVLIPKVVEKTQPDDLEGF